MKFGFFSVQVSEFMKIALAIVIAKYITKINKVKWKDFFMLGIIIGIPFVLIALQPDMGTALILASLFVTTILLKGIRKSVVFFLIIIIVISSFFSGTIF